MRRTLSSICMAFCGILGALILAYVCMTALGSLILPPNRGSEVWVVVVVWVIGAGIGVALLTAAFSLRRHLRTLDAKVEGSEDTE